MTIEIITWADAAPATRRRLLTRGGTAERLRGSGTLVTDIQALLDDVRERGDAALVDALQRFDGVSIEPSALTVGEDEIEEAERSLPAALSEAIDLAIARSRAFNAEIVRRASWTAKLPTPATTTTTQASHAGTK